MILIQDRDGSADPVLLSALLIIIVACLAVLAMIGFAAMAAYIRADHVLDVAALGTGIKDTLYGLAAFLAGVGAYWAADGVNAKKSAEAKP